MYEEIKPLQMKQLEILKEFKRVCEANNLTYFLAYGSMIGAVRHKGFIPWDDDIDVFMPYQDWIRLETEHKDEFRSPYFLQSRRTDPQCCFVPNKLRDSSTALILKTTKDRDMNQGIDIDVYPIYNLADGSFRQKIQYLNTLLYMQLVVNRPPQNHGKLVRFGGKVVLKLIAAGDRKGKIEKYHARIAKYSEKPTKYMYVLTGNPKAMFIKYPSDIFADKIMVPFEDDTFPVPVGYDEFLTMRYGKSYMQLPPEAERGVKLTNIIKIDLDHPYTDYKGTLYCEK